MNNFKISTFISRHFIHILLGIFILTYIGYFSFFTILRYKTLYASYFDLSIMHQTVFNTYRAISTFDWHRLLELTEPYGPNQIKRMAIHNDILLAPLAIFYLIYSGPETLLVVQTVVLALGAIIVYKLCQLIIKPAHPAISLTMAFCYLLFPYLQRANIFEFHAVTLAITLLLGMFYCYLKKWYGWSIFFLALSLLSKEEVGLTTAFFGAYVLYTRYKAYESFKDLTYPFFIIGISLLWFALSIFVIIPHFRGGGQHFALGYYSDFGDTPSKVLTGIFRNPASIAKYIFRADTFTYFFFLLGPLGFLSILSPIFLLIALPEFAINLLSNNWHLRELIFHYTSVIQPFIFISAIYGINKLLINKFTVRRIVLFLLFCSVIFAYWQGPLPFAIQADAYPFTYPRQNRKIALEWSKELANENIKVAASPHISPLFASRRYLYNFSDQYYLADYVVVERDDLYADVEKERLVPPYLKLQTDRRFQKVYQMNDFEVYKKIAQ